MSSSSASLSPPAAAQEQALHHLRRSLNLTGDTDWSKFVDFFGGELKLLECVKSNDLCDHPRYGDAVTFCYNRQRQEDQPFVKNHEGSTLLRQLQESNADKHDTCTPCNQAENRDDEKRNA